MPRSSLPIQAGDLAPFAGDVSCLWGKARGLPGPYPLLGHLLDAAGAAVVLSGVWLTRSQRALLEDGTGLEGPRLDSWLAWLAGAHDVGKATPSFQQLSVQGWSRVPGELVQDVGLAGRIGHDEAGQRLALDLLPLLGEVPERVVVRVAEIIGGHHGVYGDAGGLPGRASRAPGMGGPLWVSAQERVLRRVLSACGSPGMPGRVSVPAAVLATGLVVIADWLVSQESWISRRFPQVPVGRFDEEGWLAAAVEGAPQLLRDAGLVRAQFRSAGFTERFGFPARGVQADLEAELPGLVDGPGLLLIAAPTGEGKTEAALHASALLARRCGAGGIFVALPTMATSDQMLGRVLDFTRGNAVGPATATLLHSMAAFNGSYTALPDALTDLPTRPAAGLGVSAAVQVVAGEDLEVGGPGSDGSPVVVTGWLRGSKRGLLSSVSVGTVDQVLATVLRGRHQALRMLGLTGRVLVVDEAHAYDPYMQELLRRALVWLGAAGVPVVLLSATIAARTAGRLLAAYREGAGHPPAAESDPEGGSGQAVTYPGWAWLSATSGLVTSRATIAARDVPLAVELATYPPGDTHVAASVRAVEVVVGGGGNALIVCTTVRNAQETYRAVQARVAQIPAQQRPVLFLLHSRFTLGRRLEITEQVTSLFGRHAGPGRPRAAIVVATQVVEQSLDVDFDVVVSHLAPVALLLQRAGRCHRHAANDPARPARLRVPRLVVVAGAEHTGALRVDPAWTFVYPTAALEATWRVLRARPVCRYPDGSGSGRVVNVPGDVQELVDQVDRAWELDTGDDAAFTAAVAVWLAQAEANEGLARLGMVGAPATITSLTGLTAPHDADERLGTRLGADQARVLPVHPDAAGRWWLDSARTRPVPGTTGGRPVRVEDARAVVLASVPVRRSRWTRAAQADTPVPTGWADVPWLGDMTIVPITGTTREPTSGVLTHEAVAGGRRIRIDDEYGLSDDPMEAGQP